MVTTQSTSCPYRTLVSRAQVEADAVKDGGGSGERLRPHELLKAALASCVNISAGIESEARGLGPVEIRTAVSIDRAQPGKATFRYRCRVDGPLRPDERASLEAAAAACVSDQTLLRTAVLAMEPTLELAP